MEEIFFIKIPAENFFLPCGGASEIHNKIIQDKLTCCFQRLAFLAALEVEAIVAEIAVLLTVTLLYLPVWVKEFPMLVQRAMIMK